MNRQQANNYSSEISSINTKQIADFKEDLNSGNCPKRIAECKELSPGITCGLHAADLFLINDLPCLVLGRGQASLLQVIAAQLRTGGRGFQEEAEEMAEAQIPRLNEAEARKSLHCRTSGMTSSPARRTMSGTGVTSSQKSEAAVSWISHCRYTTMRLQNRRAQAQEAHCYFSIGIQNKKGRFYFRILLRYN